MASFAFLLFLPLIATLCSCQTHIGPIGELSVVQCPRCDLHRSVFPACVNETVECAPGEVCKILYGDTLPRAVCELQTTCQADIEHHLRVCAGGGVEVEVNTCHKCCASTNCVDDLMMLLETEFPETPQVVCPDKCADSDIPSCLATVKQCHPGQYCQVKRDKGEVKGHCDDIAHYQQCLHDLAAQACTTPVGTPNNDEHNCVWDCCTTNSCLVSHFGANITMV